MGLDETLYDHHDEENGSEGRNEDYDSLNRFGMTFDELDREREERRESGSGSSGEYWKDQL